MRDRALVALDVDGTVLDHDGRLSERVRTAVQAVAGSGRHVVLSTGRSLVATLPVLDQLGLTAGFAVTSNGAVTVRLDPDLPDGYEVVDLVTFDPTPALRLLREHLPNAIYAVEELGMGFRLTGPFPDGEQAVNDRQRPAPLEERFGSRAIFRFGDVLAFGVLDRDDLPATAPLLRPFTCRPIG